MIGAAPDEIVVGSNFEFVTVDIDQAASSGYITFALSPDAARELAAQLLVYAEKADGYEQLIGTSR